MGNAGRIRFGLDIDDSMTEENGIQPSEVHSVVVAYERAREVAEIGWGFLAGELDVSEFRYAMDENGYEEDVYRDVETWSDGYDFYAVLDNMIILATQGDRIRTSINLAADSSASLHDNENFVGVLERLPAGIFVVLEQPEDEDYRVGGLTYSMVPGSDDIMEVTGCFKYMSEGGAQDDMRPLEEELERRFGLTVVDSQRDGEYVLISAQIDPDDVWILYW